MTGNAKRKGDSKDQLNFRVKIKTIERLKKEAQKHNCKFRGSPSISELLDKIGEQELVILKKPYQTKHSLDIGEEKYCVNFQIKFKNYPGTLARIARILSDWTVNIIGLEATSSEKNGYFDIIALLPPNLEPTKILEIINKLTLGDIWLYVEEIIKQSLKVPGKTDEEIKAEMQSYQEQPLVCKTKCSISIEVVAASRVGLLADLALEIAQEGINLISACRDADSGDLSVSHFHLEWTTIERTKRVIETLKKVPSVTNVRQTDISEIIQRFERIRLKESLSI